MKSLWNPEDILNVEGDPNSPYVGFDATQTFWLDSGSFTHRRFSLVPSFKIKIDVQGEEGEEASLYFECHDIGDYDLPGRSIASDTFLAGTIRKVGWTSSARRAGRWVLSNMTAGKAFPLSVNFCYFP